MTATNSLKIANQLLRADKLDDARREYEKLIELRPGFAWTYYYLAQLLVKQKKLPDAVSQYQQAIKLNPSVASFHNSLAEALIEQGKLDEAINYSQKAISLQPDVALYYQTLAFAYEAKSDFCQALKTWQKIVSLESDRMKATKKLHRLQTDIAQDCINLGDELNKEGKIKEALECYQQALTLNPQQRMPVYRSCGNNLITLGRFEEAERVFQQLIELHPKLPDGYHGYARVTHNWENWELALKRWSEAIVKFPHNVDFQAQKGNVLINLSRFDEAEAVFQSLKEKHPERPHGYEGYAKVAHGLTNRELALERWQEAIHQWPQHLNFHVQKGNMLINLFRYGEAETLFEELVAKYPDRPQGYDGLARVSMQAQKWEEALTRWQTAIEKFAHNLAFLIGQANAYIELKKFDFAQDLADKIFRQYPQHHQEIYELQTNILLRRYGFERSISSLVQVEDYFKSLLSTHPLCEQILLESINQITGGGFILGIIGVAVKNLLDDYFLEISPGEILACTLKRLISKKLGDGNLELKQANQLCTKLDFRAAIDIYLKLVDEIVEEIIPDYSEQINRLFAEVIEHQVEPELSEKYGSLELAKDALKADLTNGDYDDNCIYSQFGHLLIRLGETEKGLAYLKKRVEISVYSQDAYIKLGYALLKLGNSEAAFANYRQAVKLNLAWALLSATLIEWISFKYQQLIGNSCKKLGIYQEMSSLLVKQGLSKQALEVAREVRTQFSDGYYGKKVLISILADRGNTEELLEHYQQVLKENPQSASKNMTVLRSCKHLEEFEKQTLSWVVVCDRFKIAYATIPKCACTTLRKTMRYLENGPGDEFSIISMPKHQSHKMYWVKIEDLPANYFKFVVVREPIKRFFSALSNKILYSKISFEKHPDITSKRYLSIAKLGVNPELNYLVKNLELYSEMSPDWTFHIKPQHSFMGNQVKKFDRVFQVESLGELGKKLSEITGFEVNLPRFNTGGRKISLAELSEKSLEKLIDFYARDYELLQDYYSPEKIWDEYWTLKNRSG